MAELSSLERVRQAARLKEPDVVPVAPYIGNHAAVIAGIPIDRYCTSGELMAEAQFEAWKVYRHDILAPISDTYNLNSNDFLSTICVS
jgi:uroporphyrinogen decarboxylase